MKDDCSRVRSHGFFSYVALNCGVSASLHAAAADGLYAAMRRQGSVSVVMRGGQTCEHMATFVLALTPPLYTCRISGSTQTATTV